MKYNRETMKPERIYLITIIIIGIIFGLILFTIPVESKINYTIVNNSQIISPTTPVIINNYNQGYNDGFFNTWLMYYILFSPSYYSSYYSPLYNPVGTTYSSYVQSTEEGWSIKSPMEEKVIENSVGEMTTEEIGYVEPNVPEGYVPLDENSGLSSEQAMNEASSSNVASSSDGIDNSASDISNSGTFDSSGSTGDSGSSSGGDSGGGDGGD